MKVEQFNSFRLREVGPGVEEGVIYRRIHLEDGFILARKFYTVENEVVTANEAHEWLIDGPTAKKDFKFLSENTKILDFDFSILVKPIKEIQVKDYARRYKFIIEGCEDLGFDRVQLMEEILQFKHLGRFTFFTDTRTFVIHANIPSYFTGQAPPAHS